MVSNALCVIGVFVLMFLLIMLVAVDYDHLP